MEEVGSNSDFSPSKTLYRHKGSCPSLPTATTTTAPILGSSPLTKYTSQKILGITSKKSLNCSIFRSPFKTIPSKQQRKSRFKMGSLSLYGRISRKDLLVCSKSRRYKVYPLVSSFTTKIEGP
jgi:hypothetical protein